MSRGGRTLQALNLERSVLYTPAFVWDDSLSVIALMLFCLQLAVGVIVFFFCSMVTDYHFASSVLLSLFREYEVKLLKCLLSLNGILLKEENRCL